MVPRPMENPGLYNSVGHPFLTDVSEPTEHFWKAVGLIIAGRVAVNTGDILVQP